MLRAAVCATLLAVALLGAAACTRAAADYDWTPVRKLVNDEIADGAFPGAVVLIANQDAELFAEAFGHFTYGAPPPLNGGTNPAFQLDTMFDMASCSKVMAATTAVAQLYQRGEIDLDMPVASPALLGPTFAQNGKGAITVRNCLLHNAGFPPDPDPEYWDPKFGCPETRRVHPAEAFTCRAQAYASLMAQKLANPIGEVYVYSDLSFLTLMYVVGHVAHQRGYVSDADTYPGCLQASPIGVDQCYFEAYIRKYVFGALSMPDSDFMPPEVKWPRCAPTENDTTYLNRVIQGQVSDGNAYALGGIAGHAGVFSTAPDSLVLMRKWLFATSTDPYLNSTTTHLFITEHNHTQSSRALGWNTNDPSAWDMGWNQSCGARFSPRTFMHLGYTGTMLCGDPDHGIVAILHTNRVYPTAANIKIERARQLFGDAVASVLGIDARQPTASERPIHIRPRD